MTKIAIIGAGGYVFPLRLVGDLLSFPALRDSTLALMDIEPTGASGPARPRVSWSPTTASRPASRRPIAARALDGADHVIVTFQVGGVEAYGHDVEIPPKLRARPDGRRHARAGRRLPVPALGAGLPQHRRGHAPALPERAADQLRESDGDGLLVPERLGVETVGLCHSVQGTSRMLARHLDVPYERRAVPLRRDQPPGLVHRVPAAGRDDLYPRLREVMKATHLPRREVRAAADRGEHSEAARGARSTRAAGVERVRTELMAAFGYFHTESSHHASEYVPYFRKEPGADRVHPEALGLLRDLRRP